MIVTHTLGIYHRKVRKIRGNTKKFYAQISQEEEVYEKTRIKDERRRKEVEQFITRFRAKARLANLVQSRIKTLAKAGKREKLEKLKTLDFSFRSSPFNGKQVMSTRSLSFAYDPQKPLIENLNITVGRRDRICVVGKNGKGKTTLLKLLSGVLKAQKGEIAYHDTVVKGVFEQTNLKTLVDEHTIEEEVLFSHPDVDRRLARNICGAMLFEGSDALKKIGVLSGGEKSRVMLGKLLAVPVNFLLLDEPSNHLDMESSDALLAAIDNFEGTVIMVTHNEMFLHTLAERLIVFQKDETYVFEGGYQRFLEKEGWEDEAEQTESSSGNARGKGARAKLTKKEIRRRRSELITERAGVLKPLEQSILQTENDIEKHEKTLDELNVTIQEASQAQDGAKIAQLSQSIHRCRSEIDRLFDELEEQTNVLDKQKAVFKNKMEQFESDLMTS
jgi:ATP-binding cassette subfamily F protein 3